ncbi:MAG: ABC transporter substrate-binding protein [Burkholderiales bacterium]
MLALLAMGAAPFVAKAQTAGKIPKVGVLWHDASAEAEGPFFTGLIEGFRKLGYVDGRNIVLEHRFPNEVPERFASMAAELVAAKVDVLIGVGSAASQHVKNATSTIPIVFMYVPDPVRSKLIESLGRPGGNATGLTNSGADLIGLRLQFLKEFVPALSRVALLVNPNIPIARTYIEEGQAAGAKLRLQVVPYEAGSLEQLKSAFDAMVKARVQAVSSTSDGLFYQGRVPMAKLALERRLPLIVPTRELLVDGALMSYGPDHVAIARRTPVLVDKILKGTKPADIPVEQPTRFEFLISAKTVQALGMKIPPALLTRADEVIK